MPRITIRFTEELYEQIQDIALEEGIALADVIRQGVSHNIEMREMSADGSAAAGSREIEQLHQQIQTKDEQIRQLNDHIQTKDAQIDQLHQLVAMAQSNQADTLKQLEDLRGQRQRRWWQFWS